MSSKVFGYCRVSSQEQNERKQVVALKEFGIEERDIFIDKGRSGKDFNREQYQLLKGILRENDCLVVQNLSRLGRNYTETRKEWECITQEIKADIVVLEMPLLDTRQYKDLLGTFISDLVLSVLSYNADQERRQIRINQRKGIDIALKDGTKTGNPYGRPKIKKPQAFDSVVLKWKNGELKSKEAMSELGLKPNTFYEMVKEFNLNYREGVYK